MTKSLKGRPSRSSFQTLHERLRSGNVYLPDSRQYAPLESYLLLAGEWASVRAAACQ